MNDIDPADVTVRQTIDREAELLNSAVDLVANGAARSTTIVGLRAAEAAIIIARRHASGLGVLLEPIWGADEGVSDVRVWRPVSA